MSYSANVVAYFLAGKLLFIFGQHEAALFNIPFSKLWAGFLDHEMRVGVGDILDSPIVCFNEVRSLSGHVSLISPQQKYG